ncbi:FkbM family methyltransferase [Fulvimarina sp. MAC3]
MNFVSHAQNFEDVILWRALKHIEHGFYIDVGAQDPVDASVSKAFYDRGWRGVHVEANASYAEKLRVARPDEKVLQVALDREEGEIAFYEIAATGLSTGKEEIAREHESQGWSVQKRTIPSLTLASILDDYADRNIHWLKIDVEGMEKRVIEGWQSSSVRPWIVLVESTIPLSEEQNYQEWEDILVRLGYNFKYFDGLNRFYVHTDHLELGAAFGPGPNFFDHFKLTAASDFVDTDEMNAVIASERAARLAAEQDSENKEADRRNMRAQFEAESARRNELEGLLVRESEARIAADQRHRDELTLGLNQLNDLITRESEARIAFERWHREEIGAELSELKSLIIRESEARIVTEHRYNQEIAHQQNEFDRRLAAERHSSWEAQHQAAELRNQISAFRLSRSWRVTAPLRRSSQAVRWLRDGTSAWLKFKPGSRPRRLARLMLSHLALYVARRPALSKRARKFVNTLPTSTQSRLRSIVFRQSQMSFQAPVEPPLYLNETPELSRRSRVIYNMLSAPAEIVEGDR